MAENDSNMINLVLTRLTLGEPWRPLATCLKMPENGQNEHGHFYISTIFIFQSLLVCSVCLRCLRRSPILVTVIDSVRIFCLCLCMWEVAFELRLSTVSDCPPTIHSLRAVSLGLHPVHCIEFALRCGRDQCKGRSQLEPERDWWCSVQLQSLRCSWMHCMSWSRSCYVRQHYLPAL